MARSRSTSRSTEGERGSSVEGDPRPAEEDSPAGDRRQAGEPDSAEAERRLRPGWA